MEFIDAL